MMARAVFEPLATWDASLERAVPYLAESFTPVSDDLMAWDVKLRPGITFHDGTPVTSEAIVLGVERQLADPLISLATAPTLAADDPDTAAFEPVEAIDELTARFYMRRPSSDVARWLTGQLGYLASPTWVRAAMEDPTLNQAPVGTGPFRIDSRTQDQMTRFVRNDSWWRGDVYLDAVEFYIYTDSAIAADALVVGDLEGSGTSSQDAILIQRDAGDDLVRYEWDNGEESFGMMNTSHPPFDDIRARKALTNATARQAYLDFIGQGVSRAADSFFTPESPYHNPDLVQEADSPDLATPLVAELCAEKPDYCSDGRINMEFQYSGPSVIQDRVYDILTDGWSDHFNINKDMLLQDDHITQVAFGLWDFVTWRQMGSPDPDNDVTWINCDAIGGLALNWPRFCDPARDELLYAQRASTDQEERRDLWRQINAKFRDDYTYILFNHTMWSNAFQPTVKNLCGATSPDGVPLPCTVNGWHHIYQLWLDD